jgi:hypothetical protein
MSAVEWERNGEPRLPSHLLTVVVHEGVGFVVRWRAVGC